MNKSSNKRVPNVTLRDVAKAAAVSASTVSNVINNARYVRKDTRQRVEESLKKLGYSQNKSQPIDIIPQYTNAIGVIIPEIANPFFSDLVSGSEDVLENAGYFVSFGNANNDIIKQRYYFQGFLERQIDGLILVVSPKTGDEELLTLSRRIPIVLVDRVTSGWNGDCVINDNQTGMQLAVNHLVSLGHRMISLINGDAELYTTKERRKGFELGLNSFDLAPVSISEGVFSVDSGYMQTISLLYNTQRPTAICAGNDLLAIGAMRAIFEAGLRIPEDISIIGYDDNAFASFVYPPLTTISQFARSIGVESARLILKRLRDPQEISRTVVINPKIIIRHSTSKPS